MSRLEALKAKFAEIKAQKIAIASENPQNTLPVVKENPLLEGIMDINGNVLSVKLIVPFYVKQIQIYNSKKGTIHTEVLSAPKMFITINPQKTNGNAKFVEGDMCKILAYPLDNEKNVPSTLPSRSFKYSAKTSEIQIKIQYQSDQETYKKILELRTVLAKSIADWRTQAYTQLDIVFAKMEKKFEEVLLQKVTPEDLSDLGETTEDIITFFISELLSPVKTWVVGTLTLEGMLGAASTSNVYAFVVAFAVDKLFSGGIEGIVKQPDEREKQAQEINDNRQKVLDWVRDKILPDLKQECRKKIADYETQFGGEAEDMDDAIAMANIIDRFETYSKQPMSAKLADALGNTFPKLEERLKNKALDSIFPKNNTTTTEQKNNSKESPKPKPNFPSTYSLELMLETIGITKALAQKHTTALQKGYDDWCAGKYPIAPEHMPDLKDAILKTYGSYKISLLNQNDIANFQKVSNYFSEFNEDSADMDKVKVFANLFKLNNILAKEPYKSDPTSVKIIKADLQIQVTDLTIDDYLNFDFSKIVIKSISYQLDVEAIITTPLAKSDAVMNKNYQFKSSIKFR